MTADLLAPVQPVAGLKVALLGARGNAGSRILQELRLRGHAVTVITRQPHAFAMAHGMDQLHGLTLLQGDAGDGARLATQLAGHDALISAIRFLHCDPRVLIEALRRAQLQRYLVVGGAGTLEAYPALLEMDRSDFPASLLAEARHGAMFLQALQTCDLAWTFLSPSRLFLPGQRTGRFRLGRDRLLVSTDGTSAISFEDYAVALVDELEQPRHLRQRFTVGY